MNSKRSIQVLAGVASLLAISAGHATIISTTGVGEIIAPPNRVLNGQAFNDHQQGFNEKQGVLLGAPLSVDSGSIAANTTVDSHMIFLNLQNLEGPESQVANLGVVWTFSGPILGVMSDNNGTLEVASSGMLGNPGTLYPASGFNNRGLEANDSYVINGNQLTVNMRVTQPGDWIRVVTQSNVPDAGTSASLLATGILSLGILRRILGE